MADALLNANIFDDSSRRQSHLAAFVVARTRILEGITSSPRDADVHVRLYLANVLVG